MNCVSLSRWQSLLISLLLVVAVWLVFGQTQEFEFVNADDNEYVYENPPVKAGLTLRGVIWAFTRSHSGNWHPLTWLSHMLDCQLYELNAGGHHVMNVVLHAATAVLLFLMLRQMTGAPWPSAFVAAVFAIHPLHVESVVWVSERKDVLSGLFFVLTLWTYCFYVRRPGWRRYLLVALTFTLGLMSKPSLVTLPCLLLLLDYWPLQRFPVKGGWRGRVFLEKLPLLVLSAASGVATAAAQEEALGSLDVIPVSLRIGNAAVSYVAYIVQMFWPANLAPFYPHRLAALPGWQITASAALLSAVSAAVWAWRRSLPYLLTGWLWYLGMLVPMIGLVQVGSQARADRYTYLSQIGLYLMVAWTVAAFTAGWRWQRAILGGTAAVALAALGIAAHRQVWFWQDSERLWKRSIAVTGPSEQIEVNLAAAILEQGRVDEALARFRRITQAYPDIATSYLNLGYALMKKGEVDEAMEYYRQALTLRSSRLNSAKTHNNLGMALVEKDALDEAIPHYRAALEIAPEMADARNNLGIALARRGEMQEAITHWNRTLELDPRHAGAYHNLGLALSKQGRMEEAISKWQKALQIDPGLAEAREHLGIALMEKRRIEEAMNQWQLALEAEPANDGARFNLAAALMKRGELELAIEHFEKGLESAPANAKARFNLGMAFKQKRSPREAVAQLEKAKALVPSSSSTLNELAWLLATWPDATVRDGPRSLELAQEAVNLSGGKNPAILDTLAAALAECGRFEEATETAREALELARTQGAVAMASEIEGRLALFKSRLPYRESH